MEAAAAWRGFVSAMRAPLVLTELRRGGWLLLGGLVVAVVVSVRHDCVGT